MAGPDGNGCVDSPSPLQMVHRTILILVVGGALLADSVWSAEPSVNVLSCVSGNQTVLVDPTAARAPSKLFRSQYRIQDPSFVLAQVCADLNNDGKREIVYSSRGTKATHLLHAADGTPLWSKKYEGAHQSVMAHDLDGDGKCEILFTVSSPGRLYVLDPKTGDVLRQWDAGDWKIGNSPVIIDADHNGVPDGYVGTRGGKLARLNLVDLTAIKVRTPWGQCGCYTSALDVDHDGRWDLFAGSGDDHGAKGTIHRYDPLTLRSIWSYKTNDNASSADMVLADIDGDGQVEIIGMTFGSEVYCLDSKGHVRWRKDLRPELDDSAHAYMAPILCDLNGDRELEILALTNGKGKANGVRIGEHVGSVELADNTIEGFASEVRDLRRS